MRRAVAVLLGVALAGAAIWVRSHAPDDYDRRYAPLAVTGHVGTAVTAGRFTVRVESVTVARSISSPQKELLRPEGVFVVVTTAATSRRDPLQISTALLRTRDGREFRGSGKDVTTPAATTLDDVTLSPGLWRRGPFVFEIPPSLLAGATLLMSDRLPDDKKVPEGFPPFGFELTAQANVPLGIGEATARRMVAAAAERVTVPGARS
ncbi:hypothetical protein GCM10023195_38430 [Actinoallomurus liliacearum]|uniref:DUF4352 domain-containing protein n=1 Tax=Actinoallomurus liliacearum TaxID=1080073 RepID=A0ABP8TJ07_9ACTN